MTMFLFICVHEFLKCSKDIRMQFGLFLPPDPIPKLLKKAADGKNACASICKGTNRESVIVRLVLETISELVDNFRTYENPLGHAETMLFL